MSGRLLIALLAVLLLLFGTGLALLGTETGLRWGWERLTSATDGQLKAESVQGRLLGQVRLKAVSFDTEGTDFSAEEAIIDLRLSALLLGRLSFASLDLRRVRVERGFAAAAGKPGKPPRLALPLTVEIRNGRVGRLLITRPEGPSVLLRDLNLSGRVNRSGIHLERSSLAYQGLLLSAEGSAGPGGEDPVDLDLSWRWSRPDFKQPLRGRGTISGTWANPKLEQALEGPIRGTVKGHAQWWGQPLHWAVEGRFERVAPADLRPDLRETVFAGVLTVEGSAETLRADWQGRASDPELGEWTLQADLTREIDLGWKAGLHLTADETTTRLEARARWPNEAVADSPLALKLLWQDLRWPERGWKSDQGTVSLEGTLDDYRGSGSWELSIPELPASKWSARFMGDRRHLAISDLQIASPAGKVSGEGRLELGNDREWWLRSQAEGINPGLVRAGWKGKLDGTLEARGRLRGGRDFTAELTALKGDFNGYPVAGEARLAYRRGNLEIGRLDLRSGPSRLRARGSLTESWNITWSLNAPSLDAILPDARGTVRGEGELSGPRRAPRLRVTASGNTIAWENYRVGSVRVDADVDLNGEAPWTLNAKLSDLILPRMPTLKRLSLEGGGTAARHSLKLSAAGTNYQFNLDASGGLVEKGWQGLVQGGELQSVRFGRWRQREPSAVKVEGRGLRLEQWCWESLPSSFCFSGNGSPAAGWELGAVVDRFPFEAIQAWLPLDNPTFRGRIDGQVEIGFRDGIQRLEGRLGSTGGHLDFRGAQGKLLSLAYRTLAVGLETRDQGMAGRLEIRLVEAGYVEAVVSLPGWQPGEGDALQQPIKGQVSISLTEMRWVSSLLPDVVVPEGQLQGELLLGGRVADPELTGDVRLREGLVVIPALGIELRQIQVSLKPSPDALFALEGSVTSGSGTVQLDGHLPRGEPRQLVLRLRGERFEAVRVPRAQLLVSPDLGVTIRRRRLDVSGTLVVPEGTIRLLEFRDDLVEPSPDVVIVDDEVPQPGEPWRIVSNVTLIIGERVNVTGYGFSGRVSGRLSISEQALEVATARGELSVVDGRYEAYGQKLAITRGRLLFANSPLNNPGLDVRAVRELEDVVVGVAVQGRLKNPEVRLFSQPQMDESEILSYLILGRSLATASDEDADVLQRAALSLGLAGGERLAKNIADELGVDVVDVASAGNGGDASLVLGKYLSPRLYVQYAVGIAEAVNTFRVRYRLGKNWVLEAESGATSGADLLYSIER